MTHTMADYDLDALREAVIAADGYKTDAEKRAYARGYKAGKKRADREAEREARRREAERRDRARRRFRQEAFMAALNATIINGKWQTGGTGWTKAEDYAVGCWAIANAAVRANGEPWA